MRLWNALLFFVRSVDDFRRDGGMTLAGSISYFSMMAIVPFFLFLIAIFGHILGLQEDFFRFLVAKLVNFFPAAAQSIARELREIISSRGIGAFTFIIYGFLSYQLYSCLENATNVIFKVREKRSFLSHLLISTFLITLLIVFLLASFAASSSVSILRELQDELPLVRMGVVTAFIVKYVVPFVLVFVTLATLYLLLPKRRIRFLSACKGAIITTVLLEVARHFFTFYVVKVAKLGAIYGPLSAFIIFLLWFFYSSCLFLIGAEVVHNLETKRGAKGAPAKNRR